MTYYMIMTFKSYEVSRITRMISQAKYHVVCSPIKVAWFLGWSFRLILVCVRAVEALLNKVVSIRV